MAEFAKNKAVKSYKFAKFTTTPVYRAYNPNAKMGTHHYTKSKSEYDTIVKLGWRAEKIAWYAVK